MTNNPTIRLQYIVDPASLAKTRQSFNEVVQNLKAIGGQAAKDSETIKRFSQEISALDRIAAIGRLTRQFVEFSQETGDSREAVQKLRDTLREMGAEVDEINDATLAFNRLSKAAKDAETSAQGTKQGVGGIRLGLDVAGDASTVGGAVGSVLGGAGGQAAQGAAQFVGNTLGAAESISRLGETVQNLSANATGLAGTLGRGLAKGISGLGAFAAAATPALALLAAGILAIQKSNEQVAASYDAAQRAAKKASEIVVTGSEEQVKAEIEAAKVRLQVAKAESDRANQEKARIDKELSSLNLGVFTGLAVGAVGFGAQAENAEKNIKEANAAIVEETRLINELEGALQNGKVATKSAAEIEAELRNQREKARQEMLAAMGEAVQLEIEYAQLLKDGTSAAIKERISGLEAERDAIQKYLNEQAKSTKSRTEDELKFFEEQKKRIDQLNRTIDGLNTRVVAGVEAREREERAIQSSIDAIGQAAENQTRLNDLVRTGTAEQIKARQDAIDRERAAIEQQLAALKALPDTTGKAADEIKKVEGRLADLKNEAGLLSQALPGIKLRELGEGIKKGVEDAAKKAQDAAKKVQDALQKQQGEIIGAVKKYDDDVARIEEDALKRRADAQKNYNDALIAAAKRAADDATKALEALKERRSALARDFGRAEADATTKFQQDRLNAQIEYQRQEADAERDRVRRLEDIRKDAQRREFDLILNRDFAGLFASRLDTTRQIEDTNTEFGRGQQDRAAEFAQNQADAARAFELERQQRQAKYQQDLADAQAQYEKERAQIAQQRAQAIAEAQANRAKAIADDRAAYQQQLAARRQALQSELRTIADFGREKIKVEAEILKRGLEIIRQLGASASGSKPVTRRATGGPLMAGQPSLVNDGFKGQRESFNGAMLPGGMGLFIPSKGGSVSPGAAPNVDLTFNVTGGNDPAATAQAIRPMIERVLKEVFA